MKLLVRASLTALLLAPAAFAAARHPIRPEFFGINGLCYLHYRNAPDATSTAQRRLKALRRSGASCDRTDFWWGIIEPQRGNWDWSVPDRVIGLFEASGIRPLPILSYNAAWDKDSPTTPGAIADYAEYVSRTVGRYKGCVREWEVWNEPNIETFWSPRPDVHAYSRLLAAAHRAAKEADPDCTVVGCATSMTDVEWMRGVGGCGGFAHMDALSFHPYPMADGPEEMDLHRQIRNVRRVAADHGRPRMPLWITEMGWQSDARKPQETERHAAHMVMAHVIAAAEGVERLYWFNLQDWIEDGKLVGWGMLSPDWQDKGIIAVHRVMVDKLTGARYEGIVPCAGASVYAFRKGGDWLLVAWAHRGNSPMLRLPAPARRTLPDGSVADAASAEARLTTTPVYLELRGSARPRVAAGPPPRESVLVNPSFEELETTKPYGWDMGHFSGGHTDGIFGVDETGAADGRRAARISHARDAAWESWPLPVYPGEQVTLTGKCRARDAAGDSHAQIVFMGGAGWGWLGGPRSEGVLGTCDWRKLRVSGTVPRGATMARILLASRDNPGSVCFDDLKVEIREAETK